MNISIIQLAITHDMAQVFQLTGVFKSNIVICPIAYSMGEIIKSVCVCQCASVQLVID